MDAKTSNPKTLIVVWSRHSPRATNLAAALGCKVSFQYETGMNKRWQAPFRYFVQAAKTWRTLQAEKPDAVIARTPPVFGPLVVAAWCAVKRKHFVLDCDTGTFHSPKWKWAGFLHRWLARRAMTTLVIDQAALRKVQSWKVSVSSFQDKVPVMVPPASSIGSQGQLRVAVISSFDVDEPVAELLDAARLLPHVTFYHTGDPERASSKLLENKPKNVILTGFLRGGDYTGLLKNVHGLVVLTNEPNALNCGAYEAMAIEKPAVVSDWDEMRNYFSRGFIHVKNTPPAIAAGITKMLDELPILTGEIRQLRVMREAEWQQKFEKLADLLSQSPAPAELVKA